MQATQIRKGSSILYNGEICVVQAFRHSTPGNKRGFVQVTMRGVESGKTLQNKFSADENVERVIYDPRDCQFLYKDDEGFHFMDMESYDNFRLSEEMLGDMKYFLVDNMDVKIQFYDGKPVIPEIPKIVTLKVTHSPPGIRGDSVSNNMKPAECETGLKLQVPMFIEEGVEIKVNTESGEYLGRA